LSQCGKCLGEYVLGGNGLRFLQSSLVVAVCQQIASRSADGARMKTHRLGEHDNHDRSAPARHDARCFTSDATTTARRRCRSSSQSLEGFHSSAPERTRRRAVAVDRDAATGGL